MSYGLAMGPKARRNMARPTGQAILREKIADEHCNRMRVTGWAKKTTEDPETGEITTVTFPVGDTCGHEGTISFRNPQSGRTERRCLDCMFD